MNDLMKLDLQFFSEDKTDDEEVVNAPEKTFTQAELDEIVKQRISRVQKKYSDYNSLKEEVEAFRSEKEKRELESLSELEKANKLTEAETERANNLEKAYEALTEKVKKQAITMAFTESARKANIEYVADAMKLADMSSLSIDENYNVTGMDEIVTELVKEKPFLVKQKQESKGIGGPTPTANKQLHQSKTKEQLLEEARVRAMSTGRVEDRMRYASLKRELGI